MNRTSSQSSWPEPPRRGLPYPIVLFVSFRAGTHMCAAPLFRYALAYSCAAFLFRYALAQLCAASLFRLALAQCQLAPTCAQPSYTAY